MGAVPPNLCRGRQGLLQGGEGPGPGSAPARQGLPSEPTHPRWSRLPPAPGLQAGAGAGRESPNSKDRPPAMPRGERGLRSTLRPPCQPRGRAMAQPRRDLGRGGR